MAVWLSPLPVGSCSPVGRFLALIYIGGQFYPAAILQLQDFGQLLNAVTSSGLGNMIILLQPTTASRDPRGCLCTAEVRSASTETDNWRRRVRTVKQERHVQNLRGEQLEAAGHTDEAAESGRGGSGAEDTSAYVIVGSDAIQYCRS